MDTVMLRYAIGLTLMYGLYFVVSEWGLKRRFTRGRQAIIAIAVLYVPCLLILWLWIRGLPQVDVRPLDWGIGAYVIAFLALFFSMPIMAFTGVLEAKLWGESPEDLRRMNAQVLSTPLDYVATLALAPVMEEVFTRKFLYDRLAGRDILAFILFSALAFGLMHCVTGKLMVAFGTFYGGVIFALVYAASGNLWLPILYHGLFNVVMVMIPERLIKGGHEKAAGVYRMGLMVAGTVGFILLMVKRSSLWPAERAGDVWASIFTNAGTWIMAATFSGMYIYRRCAMRRGGTEARDGLPGDGVQ
ncbi:MAG: CPBP family intramembrane glutamic endopeptidase [Saccharofermentanales bacterium]